MQIIISTLGLGRFNKDKKSYEYELAKYSWGEQEVIETTFVQEAFQRWFPEAHFVILATSEAQEARRDDLERIVNKQIVEIPAGKDANEFWSIYNAITDNLSSGAEVVLDFTHGFRSLGMIAMLATIFLESARHVKLQHLVYAAHEAKHEGVTPIFDLKPFTTMTTWAAATNRFLDTGDSSKFRELIETRGSRPMNTSLNQAVKQLDRLSLALSTNRVQLAAELADEIRADIESAQRSSWQQEHAPLRLLLPRIENGLSLLSQDEQTDQKQRLTQSFGQIKWFYENRQYEKAIGLAREWMVSFGCQ
jgi:CRISPR-associated DxTHG motif protein